jgi:hypothetical protein
MMRYSLGLAGSVFAVAALLPSSGGAQVLMQRDVSLNMALAIAETAVSECEKAGNNV